MWRAMDDLYPNALLALAADIPHIAPLADDDAAPGVGVAHKRSMVCGSEVGVALTLDDDGRIADVALEVDACALGQASASVFARGAIGASQADVTAGLEAMTQLLREGAAPAPGRFAEIPTLAPIRGYPRRHASALLVWRAASAAFERARAGVEDGQTPPVGPAAAKA